MLDIYKPLARLLQYLNHLSSVFYFPSPLLFGVKGLERVFILNQAITDKRHPRSNAGPQSQESQSGIEIVRLPK